MIKISLSQLQDINVQAARAYPKECCGLLAGIVAPNGTITVTRVVSSDNVLIEVDGQGGQDRFEVDAQVRFDLMRALHETEETIIGHYHSHPDHPPEPSETDLDMAFEPELIWLITAVVKGQAGKTRAWRLNREPREIVDVPLEISETG